MSADILIVDDEADIRNLIQGILEDEGYSIRQAANDTQAYEQIKKRVPQMIILDIWLQNSDHDGLQILETVHAEHPHVPIVMISGHGNIETAVNAIRLGAYDFIEKPFKSDRLLLMVDRALEAARLRKENEALRQSRSDISEDLIGESHSIKGLKQVLDRVAQTNSRVLITGEAGTGKEIVARYIHQNSQRCDESFIVMNCATLRPDRLEAELFGSVEMDTRGLFEQAHGGTLLLDEVADMPFETQGKIVRVLQEQKFQRLGGVDTIETDVRIIATTNRDLEKLIADGSFRQDLYYRLNVVPISIPPLRERTQDIESLCEYFVATYSKQTGIPVFKLSADALVALQSHDWPGNVRQLKNLLEWLMIMGRADENGIIQLKKLPADMGGGTSDGVADDSGVNDFMGVSLKQARARFEHHYIETQIRRFGGNISKTAQFIGMERSALHRKIKQLGLSLSDDSDKLESERLTAQNRN